MRTNRLLRLGEVFEQKLCELRSRGSQRIPLAGNPSHHGEREEDGQRGVIIEEAEGCRPCGRTVGGSQGRYRGGREEGATGATPLRKGGSWASSWKKVEDHMHHHGWGATGASPYRNGKGRPLWKEEGHRTVNMKEGGGTGVSIEEAGGSQHREGEGR